MEKKTFTIEQVLSITSGILCCKIDGIYKILDFMTGEGLYTHQLPRAGKWAKKAILIQHPFFCAFVDTVDGDNWENRLHHIKEHLGATIEIEKPDANYLVKDPLVEAAEMMSP